MTPEQLPIALLALIGFAAVVPAWIWFTGEYTTQLPATASFLVQLTLPAVGALFAVSWLGGDI